MRLSKRTTSREINHTKSIENFFSHEFVTIDLKREDFNPCSIPHLVTVWFSGVRAYELIFEDVWIGMKSGQRVATPGNE